MSQSLFFPAQFNGFTHFHLVRIILSSIHLAQLIRAVKIRRLHLCTGIRTPPRNEYPIYDARHTNGEVPVMLELWGIRSSPSLPSLSGPLRPAVVAPNRVLSMGQIELNCVRILNRIVLNRTVFTFNCVNKKLSLC